VKSAALDHDSAWKSAKPSLPNHGHNNPIEHDAKRDQPPSNHHQTAGAARDENL
jgi:hypothetical protein